MKVAVVGYGVEGRASVEYWQGLGHDVAVCAPKLDAQVPPGAAVEVGPDYLDGLRTYDLIVRSPGVRPELLPDEVPTTSVIREFLDRCPGLVIGVTGTQGKGTTCTAIAAILKAAGRTVYFGGNVGRPPLEFLDDMQPADVAVLELSNFQLLDLEASPQIAVVLSITPDHLNWHTDLEEYYSAKTPIASNQRPDDVVVFDATNPVAIRISQASPAHKIPLGTEAGFHCGASTIYYRDKPLVEAMDIKLRGEHNLRNLTAAVAAVFELIGGDVDAIRSGISAVEPLPHRLCPVAEVGGVLYVNDSLSTTPETSRAAVMAYPEPKIMLLGGSSKQVPFEPLAEALAATDIRGILLSGQDSERIASALNAAGLHGYEFIDGTMAEIVSRAAALARPGDVVLLSPACASFDRYESYADRGEQFIAAVNALE